jgi:hypothetical protein
VIRHAFRGLCRIGQLTVLDPETDVSVAVSLAASRVQPQSAVLARNPEAASLGSPDGEAVFARVACALELKVDREMRGMAGRPPPNLSDSPATPQCLVKRYLQRLRKQSKGIEEVALTGPVRSDEQKQRAEVDISPGDAPVLL